MKYSIEQSEITERTEQINKFALLVDLFNNKAVDRETFMAELSKIEQTDWAKENLFNQLIGYCVLGDAYGILKSRELDFSKAYYNNEYVYKEVSYYHNVQYLITRVKKEEWAALYLNAFRTSCRVYLCLANAYDHLGRFCEAQQYYRMALQDSYNTPKVEVNQGFAYANMHSFWTEEEPFIVRKAQQIIRKYQQTFDRQSPYFCQICSWPSPSFDAPLIDYDNIQEGGYEKWICQHYLRINRFNDVEPDSMLSLCDNVKLPVIVDTPEKKALYESTFKEIKGSFISTRKILYSIINEDKNSVNMEMLKMAYKNFYSIFDKIAMFLSNYLDIKLKSYEVDFAKIWNCKNGDIRQEILVHSQNMPLLGLYNIKLDVYGMKTDWYVVDEQTKDLKMLRNYMEHKSIIIKDEPMSHTEYQLTISKQELELNTIRLAQLVRCAIIYLCNFVMHAEYDKLHP